MIRETSYGSLILFSHFHPAGDADREGIVLSEVGGTLSNALEDSAAVRAADGGGQDGERVRAGIARLLCRKFRCQGDQLHHL
eukprot:SAG22_NODE_73_length_22318_cov_47.105315_8_plen_82_part_00